MSESKTPDQLRFERQRFAIETGLRRVDQRLARDQFEFQKSQSASTGWKSLVTPTGGVLVAATLGLLGTAAGKWADNEIENQKQQTTIILKASEVPAGVADDKMQEVQRARNLLWFANAGYLTLPAGYIEQLQKAAFLEKGQAVPPPVIQTSVTGDEAVRAFQRAFDIPADGMNGPRTRSLIREFQLGLYRRDPGKWPLSGATGLLDGPTAPMLATLVVAPKETFGSSFERALLGDSTSGFAKLDPQRIDVLLRLIDPGSATSAPSDIDEKVRRMRSRIAEIGKDKGLPAGGTLTPAIYDAVIAKDGK